MRPAAPPPSFDVLQQAAEWFALLRDPGAGDGERRQWQAWHAADPAHREAWARVEAVSARFTSLPTPDRSGLRSVLEAGDQRRRPPSRTDREERRPSRRRLLAVLPLITGAGVLAWSIDRHRPWPTWAAEHRTAVGERREIRLADGSRLWLNTASAIDVGFGPVLRRIDLRHGELLVETATDGVSPARPFIVQTAHGRLRAIGTRFSVRREDNGTRVAVFDGLVEVQPADPAAPPRVLEAGRQARFDAVGIAGTEPAPAAREAWTRGLLVAENTRLGELVAELARYRAGHLGCDPAVADLRVVGTYALVDTDRVLAALAATLPVTVQTVFPGWTVIGPRRG